MAGAREGAWCHIEIPTAAVETSKRFYGGVFGWTFTEIPAMNYTIYSTGDGEIGGGLWNPAAGVPRMVTNYINVAEIEPIVQKVEANGGKLVMPKMEVPNAGWMALVTDPDGNTIGLWKSAHPAPPPAAAKPAKAKSKPAPKAKARSKVKAKAKSKGKKKR